MEASRGRTFHEEGTANAEALRLACAWRVAGTARRLEWLELRE